MSDTALPVLYSFRRCPYAMRARLALLVSGVAYETREVSLKHKPAHLLQLSPKGTVPVLWQSTQALGQQVLDESLAIMLWALRQNDPQQWLTPDTGRMQQSLNTIERNDHFFKTHLDRYKYPQRFGLTQGLEDRDLACDFLCAINHTLDGQGFLNGLRWGLADAAIAPFVRQFSRVDSVWFQSQNWPALQAWLATFEASESFLKIMQKTSAELATPPIFERPPGDP